MISIDGHLTKRIIPVRWNAKKPPLVDTWEPYMERDPTDQEIAQWNRIKRCNWAMLTGRASGYVVLDVDPRRGGDESLRRHPIPPTFVVATPSGGNHYHFVCPPGGLTTNEDFEPGLELRADGAYVLVPPSSIDGRPYEILHPGPIAELPSWLLKIARTKHSRNGNGNGKWKHAGRPVPQGDQHATLVSLAGKLARSLSSDLWYTIPAALAHAAAHYPQDPKWPWTDSDFRLIAESVCDLQKDQRATDLIHSRRSLPLG